MANKISVLFDECTPAPANGYHVFWKKKGGGPYTDAGLFPGSPAVFYDITGVPYGEYEGYIFSDCGDGNVGTQIPWEITNPPTSGSLIVTSTDPNLSIVGLVGVTNSGISYPVTATVDFGAWNNFYGPNIQANLSVSIPGVARLLQNGSLIDILSFTALQGFVLFPGVAPYANGDVMEINIQPS